MSQTAESQLDRIVSLIAWMSQRDSREETPYAEAAAAMGVSEASLREDLNALVRLTNDLKPWLASLSVSFVTGGFVLGSLGAFRRPLRFSRDEALALILGLSALRGGGELAARLGATFSREADVGELERRWAMGPTPGAGMAELLGIVRRARDLRRKLAVTYAGADGESSRRVVHPHQVVQAGGRWYLVAWCEKADAARCFRLDRVLEVAELQDQFTPRPDLKRIRRLRDLVPGDDVLKATVAFSPGVARWARERYPLGEDSPDGRYLAQVPVADPRWLVREVLQWGAGAEVLGPESMREFVRRAVG